MLVECYFTPECHDIDIESLYGAYDDESLRPACICKVSPLLLPFTHRRDVIRIA